MGVSNQPGVCVSSSGELTGSEARVQFLLLLCRMETHTRPLSLADSQAVLLWCLFDRKLYYHTMNTALATSALLPVPLPCYYFLFRARQRKNFFHLDSYTTIISSQISHSSYFLISPSTQHQSV